MNKQRLFAKLSGYSLLLMAVVAGFSIGFAMPKIFDTNQPDFFQTSFDGRSHLYIMMLIGVLIVILLDLLVSWSLYEFFKKDNEKLSLLSLVLRLVYTAVLSVAAFNLTKNITVESSTLALDNYQSFDLIWSAGLIVFGLHLLVVGFLMKLHKSIPMILWALTILAGFSYVLVHTMKSTAPQMAELTGSLNDLLALPMALGELGLAIWLIVKGGKIKK